MPSLVISFMLLLAIALAASGIVNIVAGKTHNRTGREQIRTANRFAFWVTVCGKLLVSIVLLLPFINWLLKH